MREIRVQRMPIKGILIESHILWAQGSAHLNGLGVGFVILRHGLVWIFAYSFYTMGSSCLQNDGSIWTLQFVWNSLVLLVHQSDRWFRRSVTGSMLKWSNRVNRTRIATGRWLNRLDRPVRSGF